MSTAFSSTIYDDKTTDGAGAGTFSGNLPDLINATAYYACAYTANNAWTG